MQVSGRTGTFPCEMTCMERTEAYTAWRCVYPCLRPPSFPEATNVVALYYEPVAGRAVKGPAVMCMHVLAGDGMLTKSIAAHFAASGLPALMPEMPFFLEREPPEGAEAALRGPNGPRHLAESFLAGPGDMLRSADVLASRPGVDPNRLRVMGTSMGGILAVTAAGRDPRFEKAAFLLAGGDLLGLFATSGRPEIRPLAGALARVDAQTQRLVDEAWRVLEPTNNASLLASRVRAGSVRMYNVGSDEVIPLAHARTLADALGLKEGAGWEVCPGLGHYTAAVMLPDLADELAVWFGGRPPAVAAVPGREAVRGFFAELLCVLAEDVPPQGGQHLAARIEMRQRGGAAQRLSVELRRGSGGRFAVQGTDPDGRRFGFGRGERPWFFPPSPEQEVERKVWVGTGPLKQDLETAQPAVAGVVAAARVLSARLARRGTMGMFAQLVRIEMESARRLRLRAPGVDCVVDLEAARDVPRIVHLRLPGAETRIEFTAWRVDVPDRAEDFAPPAGRTRMPIGTALLERMIRARRIEF